MLFYMKTRILVTGANGQLAQTIREVYKKDKNHLEMIFVNRGKLDITSKSNIEDLFKDGAYDYCINCAAYTNVELAESEQEKAFLVNAEGVKYLSEVCKSNNTVLIHISTDYVFDGTKKQPYVEDDITNPINAYGKSKLQGEKYVKAILEKYYIIRASWLYSVYNKNFLKTILDKVLDNAELKIINSQKGTPTSCEELSYFLFYLIKNENIPYGLYHFSASGNCSWYDYALQIAEHVIEYDNSNIQPVETFKTLAKRPDYSVLSIDKVQSAYKNLEHWNDSVNKTVKRLLQ